MQKKQVVQFSVLIVLIVVLVGAYFGIRSYNKKQEEKKEQADAAAVVALTSFSADDITAISYDYDGTVYEFEKNGDDWTEANNSGVKIDQDMFEDFLKSAGSITASSEVGAQESEDYGLDAPTRTVTVTTEKGTSSLVFGSRNDMLSQYYVKTSESSKVYLVEESVYTAFDKTATDFEAEETTADTEAETEGKGTEENTGSAESEDKGTESKEEDKETED